jgi:hypothetical protein
MELDQILKLIDAGFTKSDIEAMTSAPAKESTEPTAPAATVEEPKEAAPAQRSVEALKPEETPAVNNDFSALLEEMKSIRKQLQMQAILHDGFTPASPDDAQQILASIINPATKGKD